VYCRKNTYDDEARRYCGLISPQQGREGVIWQGLRPSHVDIAAARSGLGQAQAAGVGLDDSGACNYSAAPARRIGGSRRQNFVRLSLRVVLDAAPARGSYS